MPAVSRAQRALLFFGLFLIFAGDVDSPENWEGMRDHLDGLIGWDLLGYDGIGRGNEFADGLV